MALAGCFELRAEGERYEAGSTQGNPTYLGRLI